MANVTDRFDWITPAVIEEHSAKLAPSHVAILKAYAAGSSYDGIAAALHLNIGTVKSKLNRARIAIRSLHVHPNGRWKFAEDGAMLDENGSRSIYDDVDK